jgi:hypothetical protein
VELRYQHGLRTEARLTPAPSGDNALPLFGCPARTSKENPVTVGCCPLQAHPVILEGLTRRDSGIPLSTELTVGDFTLPARLFGLKPSQNQYLKVKSF